MRFDELFQLQNLTSDLADIHAQAVSEQVLNPRSRTTLLLDCAQHAQAFWLDYFLQRQNQVQTTSTQRLAEIITHKKDLCLDLFAQHIEDLNQIEMQKSQAFRQQESATQTALQDLAESIHIPDLLAPLRAINAYDSLYTELHKPYFQAGSVPLLFRILSRKNENYGQNNWETLPEEWNAPETLYQLLLGNYDDSYHVDLEPIQRCFLHGETGSFIFKHNRAYPVGHADATGSAPLAAVASLDLENHTDTAQNCSLSFALSSYNFAGVFLKTDTWTPLFQADTDLVHNAHMTADFVLAPQQKATVLWAATPYHFRESHLETDRFSGRTYTVYNSHALQHLQLSLFHIREVLACLSA